MGDVTAIRTELNISIHAPAKGATKADERVRPSEHNFNPRSREGSDGILPVYS